MIWMTARRFDWILRSRGTRLAAWPGAEREAALRLLRRSAAARSALADALALEDGPEPDPVALGRMQGTVRHALLPATPVLRGIRWGAIAACVAAGLYLGVPALDLVPDYEPGPTMQATSPAMVLAALDQ